MNIFQILKAIYDAAIANNKYLEQIYNILNAQIQVSEPNAPAGAEPKDERVGGGTKSKDELQ